MTPEQIERMRKASGKHMINNMTPDELDDTFQRLHERAETAERRVKELENVIVAITHADETGYVDGYGFISNFEDISLEVNKVINAFSNEQQIKALEEYRKYANGWGMGTRLLDEMIDRLRANGGGE